MDVFNVVKNTLCTCIKIQCRSNSIVFPSFSVEFALVSLHHVDEEGEGLLLHHRNCLKVPRKILRKKLASISSTVQHDTRAMIYSHLLTEPCSCLADETP